MAQYSVLRQPARAFVSALRPGPDPTVAGVTHYGAHALRWMAPAALTGGVAGGALAGGALGGLVAGSALGGVGTVLSGYALAWYRRYRWREQGTLRAKEQLHNQARRASPRARRSPSARPAPAPPIVCALRAVAPP